MFAAPNPDALRDVESQQQQSAVAGGAASYPAQGGDPSMVAKTTITTTAMPQQQPMQYQQGQYPSGGQPVVYEQQPAQTVQQQGGGGSITGGNGTGSGDVPKSTIGRVAYSMHWGTFLLLIAFFSLVIMIAAAQLCDVNMPNGSCYGTRGYQVAAGIISLFVSLIFGLIHHCGKFDNAPGQTGVSAFLFLWWVAGVIVFTFFGDFQTTERAAGYFSVWGAFILSMLSLVNISSSFEHGLDKTLQSVRKPVFALLMASLVVMGASIGPCSPRSRCHGYSAWAVVASVISLLIALVLFFLPTKLERSALRWIAYFLCFWWVFAAATLTLGGPFYEAGNGFFGTYAALLASAWFAAMIHRNT